MRHSIETRDRIFVKGCGFFSFPKNMTNNISSKQSQKCLNQAKQSATNALKITSKRASQKAAEATGDLIGNKIAAKITNVSRTSSQNSLETNESEPENIGFNREIPKERHIFPEKKDSKILMI